MKKLCFLLSGLLISAAVMASGQNPILSNLQRYRHPVQKSILFGGGPSWTLTVITPDDALMEVDDLETFVGFSIDNPCSDLTSAGYENNDIFVESGTDTLNGDELVELFPITCLQVDMHANGQFYSTGHVQFIWDEAVEAYTQVNPSVTVLDFTS